MYRDITFAVGVGRASIAAGPVFLAAVAVFTAVSTPSPVPVAPSALLAVLIVVPAIMVGGLLALIPNLIGTALLANMARSNAGIRLPVVWGLIGGLVAGGAAAFGEIESVAIAAFAATGVVCALLCRSGTRWPD